MSRDYDKTAYWLIAVNKDSTLYRSIMEDTYEVAMEKHVPQLIMMRLADFYEQRRNQYQPVNTEKEQVNHET